MFRYLKEYFDWKLMLACIILVVIGLMSIYSATFDINGAANYRRQLLWAVIGFFAMIGVSMVPIKTLQRIAFAVYFAVLGILIIVLVVGSTIKGAKSWFAVAGLGGQPSELAKVATILAFAAYVARSEFSITNLKHLIVMIGIFALPMGLIMLQPDLGTTIVFFAALLPLLYWIGASNFVLIAILMPILVAVGALYGTAQFLIAAAISGALLYYFRENRFAAVVAFGVTLAVGLSVQMVYDRMMPYQQRRIATFMNPDSDPLGAGYNVLQSKIAIGSGGLAGKGFLKGTQTQLNYIPEQWTDFIFCVPGEEFGFIGASAVLLLFAFLLWHAVNLGAQCKNRFGSVAAIGFAGIFSVHVLINTGMAMAMLPVIGIPLPFLSYGGSALVANMMMIGLLMNFYANRKEY